MKNTNYISLEKELKNTINNIVNTHYSPGRLAGVYGEVHAYNTLLKKGYDVRIGPERLDKSCDLNVIKGDKILKIEVKWSQYAPWPGKATWGWKLGENQIKKADYFILLCANEKKPGNFDHVLLVESKDIQEHFKQVKKRKGLGGSDQYYLNIWEQIPKGIKISKLEEKFNIKKYEKKWKKFI